MSRLIKTLGKANQATLRAFYGVKTINQAMKLFGYENKKKYADKDKMEVYEAMRQEYNQSIEEQKPKKDNKQKEYYKKNVIVFDYKNIDKPLVKFHNTLMSLSNKSVIVEVIDNKQLIKTFQIDIPISNFNKWWKQYGQFLFYPENIFEDYPNAIAYIYEGNKNINSKKIIQYFKEGNVNCLLKPIFNWAEGCKEKAVSKSSQSKYNAILKRLEIIKKEVGTNGVSSKEMIRISNDAQVDISIERPIIFNDDKYVEESKSNIKPLKHFIFRNTKMNHVDLNELAYLNNIEIVEREQLYEIKKDLDYKEIYYEFKRDLIGVNSISTLEKTYRINNDFFEMCNEFEIATGLIDCYVDDIKDEQLSLFIKNSTHYNATIDFKDVSYYNINSVNHIDMKCAYANYKNCNDYCGFLGKITDFRKTNKIVGVGLYQIENLKLSNKVKILNDKLKIYFDNNIYPVCELEWLKDNNCSFDITYGCWGVNTLDFDMTEFEGMMKKYEGIKGYAKYVGKCDSHFLEKKFCCKGDANLASTIENAEYYGNNEITIKYKKNHNYHLGHFTSFILAYQRLQMLDQMLEMELDNIIRVCVDGIYYVGDCYINKGFSKKEKKTFENIAGDSYVSNIVDYKQYWDCGEYRDNFTTELFIGAGGNGKTHKNLTDYGFVKVLYVAPSWKLATKKRNEYKVDSDVWSNLLSTDPAKYGKIRRFYNVILIDEVSMMTEENKEYIFKTYPNTKLIFCGDIGFQASPFSNDGNAVIEITKKDFQSIKEEKTNYRFKCDLLKDMIDTIRLMIIYDRPDCEVNSFVKSKIQTIQKEELEKIYNINDMILCRTHNIKDEYTEMFKNLEKWYITKNTRLYKNGDIVIGKKPDATCEIRHAYTIHSIQGETAEHKLFINMSKQYDKRLLYTAISRARTLEQIYVV